MRTNQDYKNRALQCLEGNWGKAVVALLIGYAVLLLPPYCFMLCMTDSPVAGLSNLWSFAMLPLSWGMTVFFLRIARSEETAVGQLFDGFKDYWRIFSTLLLRGIYVLLWTLLLIVPGIIKNYSYAMTEYVLKDDPSLSANAAIERSMALMKGNKMRLFLLHLSFIGWGILAMMTLGIGLLLLIPYMSTAQAHFYEDLKAGKGTEETI